ncbi:unnamed protein product [Heligmosomoides polygyrus]|uniref:Uncharacterized protein n=1 Tax=Heligmosomoides polygyrus TaxID=6339 RepID=A0A183FKI6_HELPZ|nr:unnamed protein product [Heligmosomoides polygyrus]
MKTAHVSCDISSDPPAPNSAVSARTEFLPPPARPPRSGRELERDRQLDAVTADARADKLHDVSPHNRNLGYVDFVRTFRVRLNGFVGNCVILYETMSGLNATNSYACALQEFTFLLMRYVPVHRKVVL